MKRKMITALLSLSVAGAMAFAPAVAFAASEDTAQTSEAQGTGGYRFCLILIRNWESHLP